MAYNHKKLFDKAIEIINKEKSLYFIEDLIVLMGISKPTFYEHFPNDSDEYLIIKEGLARQRIEAKLRLRKDFEADTTIQGKKFLYNLISNQHEREKTNPFIAVAKERNKTVEEQNKANDEVSGSKFILDDGTEIII